MAEQIKKGLRDRLDGETSGFFIAAIATAPPIWTIAFNYGAYGTVFYNHLFVIWAASIAMFLAGLIAGKSADGRRAFSGPAALTLLLPSLWMVFDILSIESAAGWVTVASLVLMALTVLISVPYITYFLIMAVVLGVEKIQSPKFKLGLVAIAIVVACCGYWAGKNNFLIMTCEDFNVAGDTLPASCWSSAN